MAADRMPLCGSEAWTFALLGPCETGRLASAVTGTGHATFIGRYTARYRECFDPATGAVAAARSR
jgi:hypothetical protein